MKILSFLQDDLILIVPSNLEENIIRQISLQQEIFNVKIISDKKLKNIVGFEYDKKAIVYLSKLKNIKPSIAEEYIENLYFIDEEKNYSSPKLKQLAKIKKELLDKQLIHKDVLSKWYFQNKKIVVYGFDVISLELKKMLSLLNVSYEIVREDKKTNEVFGVYSFEHIKDEVDYVLYEISKLLDKGIDISHIYLTNVNQDYCFFLEEYAKMYQIPLEDYHPESLFSSPIIQFFFQSLLQTKDYAISYQNLLNQYPNEECIEPLLSILNQFVNIPVEDALLTLHETLRKTTIPKKKQKNCLQIVSFANHYFTAEDYVFLLSLNQGICPKTYQNDAFLNDIEKEELQISTSIDLNANEKEELRKTLEKPGHFYLSYKRKSSFSSYTRAFFLDELGLQDQPYENNRQISYAPLKDQLDVASIYDEVYQEIHDVTISLLCSNYEIPYRKYNNGYQEIDAKKIQDYILQQKISLSYSALNNYYQCSFKYYLKNILQIGDNQGNSATDIGNLFHDVLQHYEQENFDFDAYYDEKYQKFTDISTRFYAKKLKETLRKICIINQENKKYTQLTNVLCEKKVEIVYNHPITIHFKGFIDKMMYTIEDGKTYVAIIDYKTGNPDIDLKKVDFGLSLQLPIYLYLLKHTDQFQNVVIAGFYLQKLLNENNKAGEDELETLRQSIKLQGYSSSDICVLSKFDQSYEKSEVIRSMSLTKDQKFSSYAKVLSEKEMDQLADKVEEKVHEAILKICQGDFAINPKIYDKKNVSCDFCEFKNCCFSTFKDRVYLNGFNQVDEGGDDE